MRQAPSRRARRLATSAIVVHMQRELVIASIVAGALALAGCSGEGTGESAADAGESSTSDGSTSTAADATSATSTTSAETLGTTTGDTSSDTSSGDTSSATTTGDTDATGDTDTTSDTDTTGDTSGPLCPGGGLGPGDHTIPLEHGGQSRSFKLHIPPGYDGAEPTPLVVNIHGLTSNPDQQVLFSEMNPQSDAEGFLVAYPAGLQNSWNAGACCGGAQSQGVDDVGFLRAMVAAIEEVTCVDARRIYATGMSNGGMMTNRLACEASDLFAAFAPVSAVLVQEPCQPARPIPILHFNGTADVLVAYDGGLFQGAPATFAAWAELSGCTGDPVETYKKGAASCMTYDTCDDGAEVTLCTLTGMNHCWPGNDFCPLPPTNTDISANEAMWEFFQAHPLP
mgnify:CR=1 FL=1